jgi:hypothetical protein
MNRLPNELLLDIFVLLPIVQKQECILVCRKWAGIIRSRSLLHTIRLPCDERVYNKALKRMEHQPDLCKQVEHLRPLKSRSQYIEDIHPFNITRSVLASGTIFDLTTLILHDRIDGSVYKRILPFLNSTTLLTHLSLSNATISIVTCKLIHHSLPLLRCFHLLECRLEKKPFSSPYSAHYYCDYIDHRKPILLS